MDIERRLDDYFLSLKARKVLNDRLEKLRDEILAYFIVDGVHNMGRFVITTEEKRSRTLNVEKIEEVVQT